MNIISSPPGSTSPVNDNEPRETQGKNSLGEAEAVEHDNSPDLSQETQSFGYYDIELQRTNTSHLQQENTVSSAHDHAPREDWLSHGTGMPYQSSPDPEKLIVEFEGSDDPMHPKNWGMRKRLVADCVLHHDSQLKC